ncbi:D-alanine--D-alanine ligase family protein [Ereboglobus luteus]|uniref:D-alanine--D-alanine ligase n=1 Tax=Ereboglobus luteus TaxID=1796921 RepID=A0A2U8DZE3_9BACT|nr:D-alanine--D-alanine ligase [Ereboglobus luteus]AWI07983.1 D-alanine--D-alanine ligase [Ereboglobus luteus]
MNTSALQPTPPASARPPIIAILAGGTSSEREVSLNSGEACAAALAKHFPVEHIIIDRNALPAAISPARHVVFSTLHGTFGEDGGMQRLLEEAGIHYAGCDAASSAFTMDKTRTKRAAAARGVRTIAGLTFSARHNKPSATQIIAQLGPDLVLKPNDEGSSVGLHIIENRAQLDTALDTARDGDWLVERRIHGRELAVGVLNGRAMGIVEIRPKSGIYDYESKYTAGKTDYLAPAPFDDATAAVIRRNAEVAFEACGCRDFARIDFFFTPENEILLIEINTLPGMTATSLLPKSAACAGLDFENLLREMVAPAIARHNAAP